ncbi:LysM peptidoglycan-binding domain-containing protein [Liquorilactobacillus sicerae]|uniref:LysM peptidoglycan-binding domain-containing protein n=1 Tax=Liquorilactobacillus sicerae TaxID=1416943 RepID=UPI002480D63E|nr:LysM peptidoglycan-binding domain-containing protein [Liquorilactobacillus sicerae]
MKKGSEAKEHYRMYKAVKYWVFRLLTMSLFVLGVQLKPRHLMVVGADNLDATSNKTVSSSSDDSVKSSSKSLKFVGSSTSSAKAISTTNYASPASSSTNSVTASAASGSYTVKSGDTLYEIAKENNITVAKLVSLSGISNADLILVGQSLKFA